jgi:hypothetical protein
MWKFRVVKCAEVLKKFFLFLTVGGRRNFCRDGAAFVLVSPLSNGTSWLYDISLYVTQWQRVVLYKRFVGVIEQLPLRSLGL